MTAKNAGSKLKHFRELFNELEELIERNLHLAGRWANNPTRGGYSLRDREKLEEHFQTYLNLFIQHGEFLRNSLLLLDTWGNSKEINPDKIIKVHEQAIGSLERSIFDSNPKDIKSIESEYQSVGQQVELLLKTTLTEEPAKEKKRRSKFFFISWNRI